MDFFTYLEFLVDLKKDKLERKKKVNCSDVEKTRNIFYKIHKIDPKKKSYMSIGVSCHENFT